MVSVPLHLSTPSFTLGLENTSPAVMAATFAASACVHAIASICTLPNFFLFDTSNEYFPSPIFPPAPPPRSKPPPPPLTGLSISAAVEIASNLS
eukprot:CAMPEP_0185856400 /NCGR_PEP_ID=MMETSP1354-20130828/28909_1 /TAXON_ID=708628 /ORGANISM="Erythrolobus madagascarensis, Strain CCMP3276" /LENGTH=93 /DNA_ID=CAMNT_0028558645 /DNA_START=584 /DNA_END=862 /DNA_ORIENTATION=+